jgi:hypothetical protein
MPGANLPRSRLINISFIEPPLGSLPRHARFEWCSDQFPSGGNTHGRELAAPPDMLQCQSPKVFL